jgi:hypothetical protein
MIDRPVFILGTGRSGTTLLLQVLALHPNFAWFSNYSQKFPRCPLVALLSRVYDFPLAHRFLASNGARYLPKPRESYAMLNYCTDSMFTCHRMLDASDVDGSTRRRYRAAVKAYLCLQAKRRFIQKHTGFARVRYLQAIFPDALFIHVYRDGRAVANSMNTVRWWSGNLDAWWWGEMKTDYMQEYLDAGKEPIVLAGIIWKTLMDMIEEECSELPKDRIHRIRYDQMIGNLPGTIKEIEHFCGLQESLRFDRHVHSTHVANMDTKWSRTLSCRQKELLERCVGEHLKKYGFC